MGGQVNVRLGDEDDSALTRCAAERGVERTTLAKSFVQECLAAWRDGRAVFDRPKQLGPSDMVAFGARLDKAVMEIDRIAETWAAHESKMHKLGREDQLAMTRARTEFIKGLPERITTSLNPIKAEMMLLAERIDKQPRLDAIDERQRQHTDALRDNTAAIRSLEQQPRTKVSYTVWDRELSGRKVGVALLGLWAVSVFSYFFAAMALPPSWIAVRSANYLLGGGDQAVCALVNYRLATDSCRTQFGGRAGKVVVRATPGVSEREL
ncbi:hypothetical protein [Sphingomonas sp. 37zxx]|uniref:hypothetical protein n=1 Tax=Sphingomonas sp. 37zxx TaxID=1550073 RepID=UPI00053C0533|nr:hypothetical protein [Sphingomonas sp. 37zxx]